MFKISDLLKTSDEICNLLPNILSDTTILTRDTIQGLHASRFAGKGETFWQFKEYRKGDNINAIDWRKSASLNKLLVKEKENETSEIIYFYYDKTKSMFFKSSNALNNKYYVSVLIVLTLSRLFLKNRENVFHFKTRNNLIKCSHDLSSFDKSFLFEDTQIDYPDTSLIKKNSVVFLISDFFNEPKLLENFLNKLKRNNIHCCIIQTLDPMEINFAIEENMILQDMETNKNIIVNEAKVYKDIYKKNFKKLQNKLITLSKSNHCNYFFCDTSKSLRTFILKILKNITFKKN